jgi:hypothetical protein
LDKYQFIGFQGNICAQICLFIDNSDDAIGSCFWFWDSETKLKSGKYTN